jgi:hypothetical protein
VPAAPVPGPARHAGRPYAVSSSGSRLTVLVYRGGALASLGHNHVIASHELSGTVYVASDVRRSDCELHLPVASLTVDEPQLRAEAGADFAADVPDSARAGTRSNMLSDALLAGERYPQIELTCLGFESMPGTGALRAQVQVSIRGAQHLIQVPLHFELHGLELVVDADVPLEQSALGLTPFSAMLGALQVQDRMQVRIHLLACGAPSSASSPCA